MLRKQRLNQIVSTIVEHGTVDVVTLAEQFAVSQATIRRDLEALEAQSVLRRTRGHATALASSLFESNTFFRQAPSIASKKALAPPAMEFL